MGAMQYPKPFFPLLEALKKLPGVGNKTAERYLFRLLEWKEEELQEFSSLLKTLPGKIKKCPECGCLAGEEEACPFCSGARKEAGTLCIVGSPRDVYAIETTGEFSGAYHVLEGLLSPMEGIGPEALNIEKLKERIRALQVREVIAALDATLEGDATALYLKKELEPLNVKISRLAFGLPLGSSLDYIDGSTLARALTARNHL